MKVEILYKRKIKHESLYFIQNSKQIHEILFWNNFIIHLDRFNILLELSSLYHRDLTSRLD